MGPVRPDRGLNGVPSRQWLLRVRLTFRPGIGERRQLLAAVCNGKQRRIRRQVAFEAARSIALDDYAGWGDGERIAVNVATLYREFGARDTPSDAATLFGWMAQLWKDRK